LQTSDVILQTKILQNPSLGNYFVGRKKQGKIGSPKNEKSLSKTRVQSAHREYG
jgi:hypothetical protein